MRKLYQLHNVNVRDNEVATHSSGDNGTMVSFQGISNLLACFLNKRLRMFVLYNNSVIKSSYFRQKD